MLPYMAAAGYNHYAKSVHIHLQDMQELETTNPEMYEMFRAGQDKQVRIVGETVNIDPQLLL